MLTIAKNNTPQKEISNLDKDNVITAKRIEFIKELEDLPPSKIRTLFKKIINYIDDEDLSHHFENLINISTIKEIQVYKKSIDAQDTTMQTVKAQGVNS